MHVEHSQPMVSKSQLSVHARSQDTSVDGVDSEFVDHLPRPEQ